MRVRVDFFSCNVGLNHNVVRGGPGERLGVVQRTEHLQASGRCNNNNPFACGYVQSNMNKCKPRYERETLMLSIIVSLYNLYEN